MKLSSNEMFKLIDNLIQANPGKQFQWKKMNGLFEILWGVSHEEWSGWSKKQKRGFVACTKCLLGEAWVPAIEPARSTRETKYVLDPLRIF